MKRDLSEEPSEIPSKRQETDTKKPEPDTKSCSSPHSPKSGLKPSEASEITPASTISTDPDATGTTTVPPDSKSSAAASLEINPTTPTDMTKDASKEPATTATSTSPASNSATGATTTLKSGNPLLSGTFGSSFGSFGSKSNAFGPFGSQTPKENPWKEKSNPWSEKSESEKKEETSEPESRAQDQYAVVSLEKKAVKTGEEEEDTIFTTRAKLYAMNLKDTTAGWKERGVGMLRLNHSTSQARSRVVMRADTLHKVILNVTLSPHTDIHKGFPSSAQSSKFVRLTGTESDGLFQYALRLKSDDLADELYGHLQDNKSSSEPTDGNAADSLV